jgi:hypothetical protein
LFCWKIACEARSACLSDEYVSHKTFPEFIEAFSQLCCRRGKGQMHWFFRITFRQVSQWRFWSGVIFLKKLFAQIEKTPFACL